jgi:hypothetical protein
MCLQNTVIYSPRWNWDGDRIVPETIVPSGRPVVGGRKQYLADVREYLASDQNAVLRRTISRDIQKLVRRLHGKQGDRYWELFRSREPGSFDFRARMVRAFVSEHIAYGKLDPSNPWQFPEETLVLRSGLCEDRAFLLAGLMLAAGISSFNIRVALGQVEFTSAAKVTAHDHMWVMYKDETGRWLLLEPLLQIKHGRPPARRPWNRSAEARYRPRFLFNDCHLWQVAADTQPLKSLHPLARRWSRLHPRFAGEVHQSILNDALHDFLQQHQRPDILQDLNAHYFSPAFGAVGPTVDQFDRGIYNPLQHFDNGYIDQAWAFVEDRLAEFKSDPQTDLQSFASAAHAIADFYAHSSYLHFAKIDPDTQSAAPYSPSGAVFQTKPDYMQGAFDLTSDKFTVNAKYWANRTDPEIRQYAEYLTANQRIISGRYAQPGSGLLGSVTGDLGPGGLTHQVPEITSTIPANLKNRPCFRFRGALPHHNEIAVDELPKKMTSGDHKIQKLYDPPTYAKQFAYRYNTARNHIFNVFSENWSP